MFEKTFASLLFIITVHFSPVILSSSPGRWRLLHENIGISAMHMQLLMNNKLVIFDRTDFGPSNLSLPSGRCRYDPQDKVLTRDCTAHSILYDIASNTFQALTVLTDTWCSSGAVLSNGTLVQTGGYNDGDRVVRTLAPCHGENCDWVELEQALSKRRWYASNQILPDGRMIIVGGRGQYSYEFYPRNGNSSDPILLDFLIQAKDKYENNLYPFLHLLPDGNLFIFANRKSILFDYKQSRVVRKFPAIPGRGSRNYPSSGSSVLLPIDEKAANPFTVEVMICGGAPHNGFRLARRRRFQQATSTCGRLKVTEKRPAWKMENMPMPRVMGDILLLPNGDVIIINGAGAGTAGWELARKPIARPLIYRPSNNRFSIMAAATRPRLYHSSAVLLPDGRVLVGGSNPHKYYNFTDVRYPTDLSLELFSPPYLSSNYDPLRPRIVKNDGSLSYNRSFSVMFTVAEFPETGTLTVRIVAPPFNTHSFSMNQRMVVLRVAQVSCMGSDNTYRVDAIGPWTAEIAPPGYYLLFLVHVDIPSSGVWVQIQ